MIRSTPIATAIALATLAAPALADDRTYAVGSFDRVRVDGPFAVTILAGQSPGARASGDRAMIDRLKIEVNGTTLVVRMGVDGWGEVPRAATTRPATITLRTPRLTSLIVNAGARVQADRMVAQKIDVAVSGSGALAVAHVEADQVGAALTGSGTLTLAGRAQRAQLALLGSGTIDAAKLDTSDLIARLDGTGMLNAAARYTARTVSSGLGTIDVAGNAKCQITSTGGGPVRCGR